MRDLPPEPASSEITPKALYVNRREIIKTGARTLGTAAIVGGSLSWLVGMGPPPDLPEVAAIPPEELPKPAVSGAYDTDEPLTAHRDVITYNNFYEFGLDKDDPARNAHTLKTRPWTIDIEGEVQKPQTIDIDTLLSWFPQEQRIYRMRCVEAWSMVIPWVGYSLAELIKKVEPQGNAKYVEFVTLADKKTMPFVGSRVLDWPYTEGLRMDEAMHPLTLLAFGMYGEVLPNQNGAPVRLVVPWKYGFKSAKSIVKIRFVEKEPGTAWNKAAANEYGFYSNVNPQVDHPRWSQATERRIGDGSGLFAKRAKTLMFNGYEQQVGQLYAGMDLKKFY
jgi:sulfoxide reductase catalytic subunit YedY